MRVVLWTAAMLAAWPTLGRAQEKPADPPLRPAGFFGQKTRVSFWREEPKLEVPALAPGQVESLWAEPIRLPDGRMTTYVPPRQVLAFLENPTEESGLAYIAWQKERMAKIARASQILSRLAEMQRSENASGAVAAAPEASREPKAPAPPAGKAGSAPGADELLYFKREGCPHCRHQDEEIAQLKAERPSLKLKILTPGEDDAVWKAFSVDVVPTLIVSRAGGKTAILRGFTPKASILSALTSKEGDKP